MKKTGIIKAMLLCKRYEKMSHQEREEIRNLRFQDIVNFARKNSPYYAQLYSGLGL